MFELLVRVAFPRSRDPADAYNLALCKDPKEIARRLRKAIERMEKATSETLKGEGKE